jgi:hypothetical protein
LDASQTPRIFATRSIPVSKTSSSAGAMTLYAHGNFLRRADIHRGRRIGFGILPLAVHSTVRLFYRTLKVC